MPVADGPPGLGPEDEVRLLRLVGGPTFVRGRQYATGGAVTHCEWDRDGVSASGSVLGSAVRPYEVTVTVGRTAGGQLAEFDAWCTCPVGHNCKHAVALLFWSQPARSTGSVPPSPSRLVAPKAAGRGRPGWERPLRKLLTPPDPEPAVSGVGLQFELVAARPVPRSRRGASNPGIRLRPVVQSGAGNWVRTGIAWTRLDYFGYGQRLSSGTAVAIALLKELRALHTAGSRSYWYGQGDEPVWLESITSRRVWDLLAQIREAGVPFFCAGRDARPVQFWPVPVEPVIDLARDGAGLVLDPHLLAPTGRVDLDAAILVGTPGHGLVWWAGALSAGRTPELHAARLSRPVDADLLDLVRGEEPLRVPSGEAARFEHELYPALRRQVGFRSRDGSVDLPDEDDRGAELILSLTYEPGPKLGLAWFVAEPGGSEIPLSAAPLGSAAEPVATAEAIVAATPGLLAITPWGRRLADSALLAGMDAVRWLTAVLPRLEGVDGLRVEGREAIPSFRESSDAPVVRLEGAEAEGGDWFDLAVEVSVAGEEVPFEALFVALAEEQSHLLLPSGTYFSLDRPELRDLAALIAEARSLHDAPNGQVRLSRFQSSLWEELEQLGTISGQAGAWAEAVAALADAGDEVERPLPADLTATLRPYQQTGFQWLATRYEHGLGGVLADDMGLGKTLQALALICHARQTGRAAAPFLVVAPTSVVSTWRHEAARFAPDLPTVAITATARRRGSSLTETTAGAGLVITSYALLRLEIDDYERLPWAGLFLDEAQFAKNPASRNYRSARQVPAPFKLAMTGTPLENSLTDLWAITSITAPGLFARPERFAEAYRVPIERHRDEASLDRLRRRLRPIMLRRTKEQVATELPAKQEQVLEIDLHPRHAKLYRTYLQRERQHVLGLLGDMDRNRFQIFRSLTLLRQAALHMALVDPKHAGTPSTKLDVLTEMLPEVVAEGHRVLIFSQFTRYLDEARRRVEECGIESCYLDGRTTKRDEVITRFREGKAPVFLISLKAGGFGLNLTEADYCILLDPWWNPATEAQAVDRVHRIGQTKQVMVYRLVAKDTIEEKVMALKAKKAGLFSSVIDGGGFESAGLTAEDVHALLA